MLLRLLTPVRFARRVPGSGVIAVHCTATQTPTSAAPSTDTATVLHSVPASVPVAPLLPPTLSLSSKQLEELNELAVALTQRGHTCVNTRASTSALTWCGKGAQQCSGPNYLRGASIQFSNGRRQQLDDVSKVLLAFAVAPWAGILIGSVSVLFR